MPDLAIRADSLGKQYRIGAPQGAYRYKSLRESLAGALTAPFRGLSDPRFAIRNSQSEVIWALKDVSFEIQQGEVVGVIGRNGAGKSTLLKILSRITEPTEGRAEVRGRVGSLLEVGTGFHPELTGRENIYLSGAILGMKRAEIARCFDEIVGFAEIGKFVDTPVKHYSSGMYLRLAFAVAAHLEPEILLVDEVLAVGDVQFQKKCLGKMGDVAASGRTVVVVSHQMNAIRSLCRTCLLLSEGRLHMQGEVEDILGQYLSVRHSDAQWLADGRSSADNPYFTPTRLAVVDRDRRVLSAEARADEQVGIVIEGTVRRVDEALTVGFAVYGDSGDLLFWSLHTDTHPDAWPRLHLGSNRLLCWLPPHLLNEGGYRIELIVSLHYREWIVRPGVNAPAVHLSVRGGLSASPFWVMRRPGPLAPVLQFESVGGT
jgi:lipopolysaccharide transport system ATP-binding protein